MLVDYHKIRILVRHSSHNPPLEQLLKDMGLGGVSSVVIIKSSIHPPCNQMLAAAVVVLLTAIIVTVVHCQHSSHNPSLCKGNPNSLDEQLLSQDLVRGDPK
jgi:hypothetical protein